MSISNLFFFSSPFLSHFYSLCALLSFSLLPSVRRFLFYRFFSSFQQLCVFQMLTIYLLAHPFSKRRKSYYGSCVFYSRKSFVWFRFIYTDCIYLHMYMGTGDSQCLCKFLIIPIVYIPKQLEIVVAVVYLSLKTPIFLLDFHGILWLCGEYMVNMSLKAKSKPNPNTFQHEQHKHADQKPKTNAARNSIAPDSFKMLVTSWIKHEQHNWLPYAIRWNYRNHLKLQYFLQCFFVSLDFIVALVFAVVFKDIAMGILMVGVV